MALLQSVISRGTHAGRPAAGSAGAIYYETDTYKLLRDNGASWDAMDLFPLLASKGDLLSFDGTNWAKLGVGSNGQVLTADSAQTAGIKWAAAGGGGATAPVWSWTLKSADYTITTSDTGILVDTSGAARTMTLPTAVGNTALYAVKKKTSDTNTVTVATTSAQTIDGASTRVLESQNEEVLLASDGSNWYVVAPWPVTTASAQLGANVTMTSANTFYDGPSVSLAKGTWLVLASLILTNASSAIYCTGKLWDGTTTASSDEDTVNANWTAALKCVAIVTPTSTTTYKISAAAHVGGGSILAAADHNGAGNTASWIYAIKIGN